MLSETIREQLKDAMRAKDQVRMDTLRGIITAFTNELVGKGRKPTDTLTEDEQLAVLKRLAKQRKDSIEQFTNGGRTELAAKETAELKIIEGFLPAMATREEIEKVARAKMAQMGVKDAAGAGKLTGAIMKEFAGRADGADVKAVVSSLF